MNRPILDRWLGYLKTLRDDLTAQTLSEVRDGFYAGAIAGLSIMERTQGAAADDLDAECREYIAVLQTRLEELERKASNAPHPS
jgi:hypothetical protein